MEASHRHFPYPVLSQNRDDYIDSKFNVELDINHIADKIKFILIYELENKKIKELLDQEKLEVVYRIESPETMFRRVIRTQNKKEEVLIDESKIKGRISLKSFIIAKMDLEVYKNELFHSDYEGLSFNIEKTSIMAIGQTFNFRLDKDMEELYNIPSIFVISRNRDKDTEDMSINFEGDKISIILNHEDYVNQQNLGISSIYQPILHGMIIMPALIYIFKEILESPEERVEQLEERRWFKSIDGVLRKMGLGLEKYYLELHGPYKLAQMILANPLNRALNALSIRDEVE